jgi:2-methylcitrate dehydratase PrpD
MTPEISIQTERLGDYLAAVPKTDLPPQVVHKTKHHVIDTVAAMVSGAQLPAGVRGLAYVEPYVGGGSSALVGGRRVSPVEAALANGMSAHADETDDSHAGSISHPGCAVVPAALAVGDHLGSSGAQVLRAVAAGYDVGTRAVLSRGSRC